MDGSVNNFLSDVNDRVPSEDRIKETPWQECFDDQSGCPYYWNVNTNAVTWEMPLAFKEWLEANKKPNGLFPSIATNVKVYNIREETSKLSNKLYTIKDNAKFKKTKADLKRKTMAKSRNSSDSEDEKITLISSYGDSDSDNEMMDENRKKEIMKSVVSEVTVLVPNTTKDVLKDKVTGFSLLATYGDDDDTDLDEEPNEPEPTQSHSTLFPVIKHIDVKQFEEPKVNEYLAKETEDIDTKAFQRKRRIGIHLTNSPKQRAKEEADEDGGERKGFGFSENEGAKSSSAKTGMKIAFVKSDTLNPTISEEKVEEDEISESHNSLKEKLLFLSEGKEQVSPVQIMLIQLETLHTALREGSLNPGYLKKWLTETCEGLVKLEEAAAPSGWLLQWDRAQKRYYYRNKVTDECQWDYPEMEDDAMDICTTPPPPADEEVCRTPVRTPSPSGSNSNVDLPAVESVVSVEEKSVIVSEPLPPGIDTQESEAKKPDLTSVLDSFYTDIAEIENTINKKVQEVPEPIKPKVIVEEVIQEPQAKKKKKVKVGSLQKKNVSKLVEKWNNVQKDLN